MPTNTIYRSKDGFTILAGQTDDEGQLLASASAIQKLTPRKICVENISDRKMGVSPFTALLLKRVQSGTNDGIAYILTAADPNGTISKPWGIATDPVTGVLTGAPTAVVSASAYGTWGSTGLKGAVVTALNATGETIASVEITFTISATTDEVLISWIQVPGATSYKIYVTDTPGTYGATTLAATVSPGSTVSQTILGSVSAGTPPSANTTGGAAPNYGSDPVDGAFGTADLTIATDPTGFAVGQQWFFYFRPVLPAGATSTGNKRVMQLFPTEVQ